MSSALTSEAAAGGGADVERVAGGGEAVPAGGWRAADAGELRAGDGVGVEGAALVDGAHPADVGVDGAFFDEYVGADEVVPRGGVDAAGPGAGGGVVDAVLFGGGLVFEQDPVPGGERDGVHRTEAGQCTVGGAGSAHAVVDVEAGGDLVDVGFGRGVLRRGGVGDRADELPAAVDGRDGGGDGIEGGGSGHGLPGGEPEGAHPGGGVETVDVEGVDVGGGDDAGRDLRAGGGPGEVSGELDDAFLGGGRVGGWPTPPAADTHCVPSYQNSVLDAES